MNILAFKGSDYYVDNFGIEVVSFFIKIFISSSVMETILKIRGVIHYIGYFYFLDLMLFYG